MAENLPQGQRRAAFEGMVALLEADPVLAQVDPRILRYRDLEDQAPPAAGLYWVRLTPGWELGPAADADGRGHRDVQNYLRIGVELVVPGPDACDVTDLWEIIESIWMPPDATRKGFDAWLAAQLGISDVEVVRPASIAQPPKDWPASWYATAEVKCWITVIN